ncbi:MAG: SDR family oxidoreductase [Candidatus Nanopelagicales bacterium]
MSVVVTAASSHLGRLAVESLLERGVPAAQITATARSVDSLADLAARGVTVVAADYHDPASLDAAFAGAEKVLLISSGSFDDRAGQHRNAIDAAARAGVAHLVYTSGPRATTSRMILMADHGATERALAESGLAHTVLRNGWYVENYTGQVATYLEHGMVGAAGEGLVSIAPRSDYAEAAAVVLTTDGHEGKVYELGGEAFTLAGIAGLISAETGTDIAYTDVPVETLTGILVGAGLPEPVAAVFADVDRGISEGELLVDPTDLATLLGRPATPAADAVKAALAG